MKKQTIIIPEVKIKLLGSIFPEKIYFDGERCKTSRFNHLLSIIFHETMHLQGQKKSGISRKNLKIPLG